VGVGVGVVSYFSIGFLLPWGNQKSEEFRESCFLIIKGHFHPMNLPLFTLAFL